MNKILDLRFVIGCFFLLTGIILLAYSFLSGSAKTADPDQLNRWCGIIFSVFGAVMIIISFKKDAHDEL